MVNVSLAGVGFTAAGCEQHLGVQPIDLHALAGLKKGRVTAGPDNCLRTAHPIGAVEANRWHPMPTAAMLLLPSKQLCLTIDR